MLDNNDALDLLTIKEMTGILKVSAATSRMLLQENIIPSVLVGKRSRRVRRKDLQTYLDALSSTYIPLEWR